MPNRAEAGGEKGHPRLYLRLGMEGRVEHLPRGITAPSEDWSYVDTMCGHLARWSRNRPSRFRGICTRCTKTKAERDTAIDAALGADIGSRDGSDV